MVESLKGLRSSSGSSTSREDEVKAVLEILVDGSFPDDWKGEELICELLEQRPDISIVPVICVTYALGERSPLPLIRRTSGVLALLAGRLSQRLYLVATSGGSSQLSSEQLKELRNVLMDIEEELFVDLSGTTSRYYQRGQEDPRVLIAIARFLILVCLMRYPVRLLSFERRLEIIERGLVSTNRRLFKGKFSPQFYAVISRGKPLSKEDKELLQSKIKVYKRIRMYLEILAKAYVLNAFKKRTTLASLR
jgi:hypothetical protein